MPRLFALLLLLLVIPGASGQGFSLYNLRNHPELRWREAETPHFLIRYPDRIAGIEVEAAVIAESTYAVLSHNLGVTFEKKIPIYLSDEDEIVNGFATPLNGGYTMIWVHQNAVAGTWTGRDKWLRRVIPHEIAHLFHYRAVRSRVGVIGLGLGDALPRFWTEGLAQYETETWDAERGERYLRVAALEGTLNYDDGRSAWNGRLLYAVGNSQVRFFAQQYGDSALAQLLKHRSPALLGLVRVHDFYRAFAATTGEPYPAFARRWRRHISAQYGARAVAAEPPESLGTARPSSLGQYVYDVRPSPADTATWAVVRLVSLGRPVRQLVLADSTGGRLVAEGAIETPVAWSPDGRRLAFAQTGRARYGSLLADLYLYSLDTRRTQRLTRNRRASSPVFSPDGRRLAYVATNVGTANVFLLDLDTGDERALTAFTGDEQIERLAWRPRTDEITLAHFTATGERALYSLHVGTGALRRLTDGLHDDRAPVWRPDGTVLAFTSLRDNVPNAFVLDPETGAVQRVTAVVQGAEATAWLPPDSTHAAGRLILLVRPSKTQDEVYVVGADRRAEAPPVNVPPHYTAWETHRPPRTVPEVLAPDTAFVLRRGRYRALSNLKPVVTVPYPFTNGRAWGLGAFTLWLEPLGKHALTGYGGVLPTAPEESFGVVTYRNGTLGPTIDATLYYFPESARIYGPDVLVERVGGGEVLVRQPLNLGRLAYAYADGVAGLTVDRADRPRWARAARSEHAGPPEVRCGHPPATPLARRAHPPARWLRRPRALHRGHRSGRRGSLRAHRCGRLPPAAWPRPAPRVRLREAPDAHRPEPAAGLHRVVAVRRIAARAAGVSAGDPRPQRARARLPAGRGGPGGRVRLGGVPRPADGPEHRALRQRPPGRVHPRAVCGWGHRGPHARLPRPGKASWGGRGGQERAPDRTARARPCPRRRPACRPAVREGVRGLLSHPAGCAVLRLTLPLPVPVRLRSVAP
jgi:hypothetical protein